MPRPWLRLWRSLVDNPKAQRLRDPMFKVWINLLCCTDDNGNLPPIEDLAFKLRAKQAVVAKWILELSTAGFIVDGVMNDWHEHQFQSDVSTERVKRFRQRSKKQSGNAEGNAPEAETEAEADNTKAAPSADKPPQSPLDLKKALWATGVTYLKASGVTEASARSFIGLLRKSHDDVAIVDAFARAEAEAAVDPVAFIKAILDGGKHAAGAKPGRRRHHTTTDDVEAFGRALAGFEMGRSAPKP